MLQREGRAAGALNGPRVDVAVGRYLTVEVHGDEPSGLLDPTPGGEAQVPGGRFVLALHVERPGVGPELEAEDGRDVGRSMSDLERHVVVAVAEIKIGRASCRE